MFWLKKKTVKLLIIDGVINDSQFEKLNQYAMNNTKNQINIILSSLNNKQQERLYEDMMSNHNNIKVIYYPANRALEKHLILVQHLSKHPDSNYDYIELFNTLNQSVVKKLTKWGIVTNEERATLTIGIETQKFLKSTLSDNNINCLRKLFLSGE